MDEVDVVVVVVARHLVSCCLQVKSWVVLDSFVEAAML
jgi:hypothetical protein